MPNIGNLSAIDFHSTMNLPGLSDGGGSGGNVGGPPAASPVRTRQNYETGKSPGLKNEFKGTPPPAQVGAPNPTTDQQITSANAEAMKGQAGNVPGSPSGTGNPKNDAAYAPAKKTSTWSEPIASDQWGGTKPTPGPDEPDMGGTYPGSMSGEAAELSGSAKYGFGSGGAGMAMPIQTADGPNVTSGLMPSRDADIVPSFPSGSGVRQNDNPNPTMREEVSMRDAGGSEADARTALLGGRNPQQEITPGSFVAPAGDPGSNMAPLKEPKRK